MIKVLFKYLVYFLFFVIMFTLFLPKDNLYFLLQKEIKAYKIELVTKNIEDKFFRLILADTNIKYEGIDALRIDNINFVSYVFKTDLTFTNIKLDSIISKFVPAQINTIVLHHTVVKPNIIYINSSFKGGSCLGYIDLLQRDLKLNISLSKELKSKLRPTVRFLKKDKNSTNKKEESYTYEYKF